MAVATAPRAPLHQEEPSGIGDNLGVEVVLPGRQSAVHIGRRQSCPSHCLIAVSLCSLIALCAILTLEPLAPKLALVARAFAVSPTRLRHSAHPVLPARTPAIGMIMGPEGHGYQRYFHRLRRPRFHRQHGNGGEPPSGNGNNGGNDNGGGGNDDGWSIGANTSGDEVPLKDCSQMLQCLNGFIPQEFEARMVLWRLKKVINSLCTEIPTILSKDPTWLFYAINFTVLGETGAKLSGLKTNIEMLKLLQYMNFPAMHEVPLIRRYNTLVLFDVHNCDPAHGTLSFTPIVRWRLRLSGAKPQEFPYNLNPFPRDGHITLEVKASVHIDSRQEVDSMQIQERRVNGEMIDAWPKLELSAPPQENLRVMQGWVREHADAQSQELP